jgi:hypothetical protein
MALDPKKAQIEKKKEEESAPAAIAPRTHTSRRRVPDKACLGGRTVDRPYGKVERFGI